MWREIGMWLLVLTVILIFGQMWFHLVEGLLSRIKSLLSRHKKPPAWHTFEETGVKKSGTHDWQEHERRR